MHLSISVSIAVIACALLFGVWYPGEYFHAAGADELVLLLVGIDLTIGPLLTLIVFRTGKPGLRFDLTVIALLQTIALIYGLSVVLESRPIFLVAAVDRFVLVSANEVNDDDLKKAYEPQFANRSWTGPQLVAAILPTDLKERNALVFESVSGRDIQFQPKFYRPFEAASGDLVKNAKPLDQLFVKKPDAKKSVGDYLASVGRDASTVGWLPMQARKFDLVMLVDNRDAVPLKALPIDPW